MTTILRKENGEEIIKTSKVCTKCGKELCLDFFPPKKFGAGGVGSQCRECVSDYHREWQRKRRSKTRTATEVRVLSEKPSTAWQTELCNQVLKTVNELVAEKLNAIKESL